MKVQFNEKKATQSAALLLRLRGGTMSYMKLIKLLYLADRYALITWGRSITTDSYVSMDRGPVLSRVLDLASDGDIPGSPQIWVAHISSPNNYDVTLLSDPGLDELSKAETQALEKVFSEHGKKSRWELVDFAHTLPEWQDPNGGAIPIGIRDILRVAGKTALESAAVENEIDDLARAETLFAAG